MIAQLYMADLRWFGFVNIYTVSQKKGTTFIFAITLANVDRF